jgi:hypothetical protein
MTMKRSCVYCGSTDVNVVKGELPNSPQYGNRFKSVLCNSCHSESVPMDLFDHNYRLFHRIESLQFKMKQVV